jgi:pimeloyl-ACP methyl ester carboxylesterase
MKRTACKFLRHLLPALLSFSCASAFADELPRRLDFGWGLRPPTEAGKGASVRTVLPGGPAARAGVKVGDEILSVQGELVDSRAAVAKLRWINSPGSMVAVDRRRDGEIERIQVAPVTAAVERHPGIEVEYRHVTLSGSRRARTLWSRPVGTKSTLPGILVVGWLSCASIEAPASGADTTDRLVSDLVQRSGAIVVRVDKPGAGDSEGVCSETGFAPELEGYRTALQQLRSDPRVDASKIAIVGLSSGGGIAPLVDLDGAAKAYVSVGGWSKTWFEHMVDLERRRLELTGDGLGASQLTDAFKRLSVFHAAFLLDRLKPSEVLARHPELASSWYEPGDQVYGRPAGYFHELQALDLAAAWGRVRVPTLVVWGEFDWIMDRSDQDLIVRLVNTNCGQCARLMAVPRMDHALGLHETRKQALDRLGDGEYAQTAATEILRFLRSALELGDR